MFGRRKASNGGGETVTKPLTVQERLALLEGGEVLLEYPPGLLQPFSRQELGRLKKRFVQLIPADASSRELRPPLKVVLQMPELRAQPFAPLVARLILQRQRTQMQRFKDEDAADELVSFSAFTTILAVFSVKQTLELKRQVLFDVYDDDSKGCASIEDFLRVISTVSRPNAARRKAICHELAIQLAPFIKQTKAGVSGVLLSDFSQVIADEEVQCAVTIAY